MPGRLLILLLLAPALLAWPAGQPTAQDALSREEAELRLEALKTEIGRLQRSLESARGRFAEEQGSLRRLDLDIQEALLGLNSLSRQIDEHRGELDRLHAERESYLENLAERHELLSGQTVVAYRLGRESRLKLLLNQDNPAQLGRLLAYYDYFSAAQAVHIRGLREALAVLDSLQARIDAEISALNSARADQQAALAALQQSRGERQGLLGALAGRIDSEESLLEELTRNRADLESLIERLTDALADIPSDLGQYQHPSQSKGALPMPTAGRVSRAFGQPRTGGLSWQGWLIHAESGTEVRAVAYGRVAYADWLRGYGLLIIIDHGSGFMSLYGNNESLLFEVGDWVQPGTVIGTVGNDSGSGQGLYFELRDNGRPLDPAAWVARR